MHPMVYELRMMNEKKKEEGEEGEEERRMTKSKFSSFLFSASD